MPSPFSQLLPAFSSTCTPAQVLRLRNAIMPDLLTHLPSALQPPQLLPLPLRWAVPPARQTPSPQPLHRWVGWHHPTLTQLPCRPARQCLCFSAGSHRTVPPSSSPLPVSCRSRSWPTLPRMHSLLHPPQANAGTLNPLCWPLSLAQANAAAFASATGGASVAQASAVASAQSAGGQAGATASAQASAQAKSGRRRWWP